MSLHDQPTRVVRTIPAVAPPPISNEPQGPAPTPARRGRGCLGCFGYLVAFLLLVPVLLVGAALLLTPVRQSVLVLGSDARPDEIARGVVGRTDTLMVVVADRATPTAALISLPRDLWLPIPGYGEERVNAAYALGGPSAARQAVGSVLGLRVDRYALIGLQGVRDVVDAVGGVEILVESDIYDPTYPTDDYGVQEVFIPAGRQRMDGETALQYARTRYQDSDFGRIARQQQVLNAVRAEVMNPLNWPRLPAVFAAIQRSVRTDVSPLDAVAIGAAFLRQPGDPRRLVVDARLVEPYVGEGGAALLLPTPALRTAVAQVVGGSDDARVEVLNAAQVAGLARSTGDRLQSSGIDVVRLGDAPRSLADTQIHFRPGFRRAADRVASALSLSASRVVEASDLPDDVDVRVLAGADLAS